MYTYSNQEKILLLEYYFQQQGFIQREGVALGSPPHPRIPKVITVLLINRYAVT